MKWRQVLIDLKNHSFLQTQKAVYAGNAVAILTPDRLGSFIGRFTYLKEVSKTKITLSTFVGNYAQLVTTLLFALIGLVLSWNYSIKFQSPENFEIGWIITVMVIICCFALFVFYSQQSLAELIKKLKWKHTDQLIERLDFMSHLSESKLHLILLTAVLRYGIFILQFHIALKLFGVSESLIWSTTFCGILYLFSTIIPSPFMGNLGTREAIAVYLVTPFGFAQGVIAASLIIWLINVVFPSILGGLILLRK